MKRFCWFITLLPLILISCGDEENGVIPPTSETDLTGKTFYRTEHKSGQNSYQYGDAQFQKIYNALNYLPSSKYETSWDHKDTILAESFDETVRLKLSFVSKTNANLVCSKVTTFAKQQNVEKYHHHYYFPEDYYAETSFYMYNITEHTFDYYDKRTNIRTEFRLDKNRCYDLYFYIKKSLAEQKTVYTEEGFTFSYKYNTQNKQFTFEDNNGNSAYGYYINNNNTNRAEEVFDFYYNDNMYSMSTTNGVN